MNQNVMREEVFQPGTVLEVSGQRMEVIDVHLDKTGRIEYHLKTLKGSPANIKGDRETQANQPEFTASF